jgi:CheY-like chemotaxis protein
MLKVLIDVLDAMIPSGRSRAAGRARRLRLAAEAAAASAPGAESDGPANGRRLLLHDSDTAVLQRAAAYFRGLGYVVDVARHAEEGEALLRRQRYDLAIVDVWTGGSEALLRAIRGCDPTTRLIVLASPLTEEIRAAAQAMCAQAMERSTCLPDLAHTAFRITGVLRA